VQVSEILMGFIGLSMLSKFQSLKTFILDLLSIIRTNLNDAVSIHQPFHGSQLV